MPEPTVTVRLNLDSSQLEQSARKAGEAVKTAFTGDGSKAADTFDKMGRAAEESAKHVQKHGQAAKEAHDKLEPLLKLFDRGKEQVTDFGKEIQTAALSFVGFAGAFEMVKRAMEQGAAAEVTRVRFENLVGTTNEASAAFKELQGIARETTTPMREVAEAAEAMYAGGESIGEVSGQMENLAKIAKITGTPLGEIGELLERIRLHGDVTFRELFRLTQATGGATRELAVQYRDIPRELELIKTASEAASKIQQTAFERAEKWHSAIEHVAQKGGLLDAVFKQFQAGLGFGGFSVAALLPSAGFGPWGLKTARELMASLNEGINQLSSEAGISVESVKRMVRAGLYTAEDLLEKAKERREAIERIAQASMESSRAIVEGAFRERQIGILDQIGAALQRTSAVEEQFGRVEHTVEATMERASGSISRGFTQVGKAINADLMPALERFGTGDWIGAIQKLPWWLQAIGGAITAIQARALLLGVGEVFKSIAGTAEFLTAKLGGAAAAEEALAAAQAQASAAASAQAAAAAEAGAAKGGMAEEAHAAAAAESELAAAQTATAEAAGTAAVAAGKLATAEGSAASAIRGGTAAGLGWLAMLKMEIDALTHANESEKEREKNIYDSANAMRKMVGLPQIPTPEEAAGRPSPFRPPITAQLGMIGMAPTLQPVWDPNRWPNLQGQAIAGTRGQLMAGVPLSLTDPKARALVDNFATGIATMKNALEQHDNNAARQAAAEIEREAGRVGVRAGLLPADQAQALNQAVSTMYGALTGFIEAAGDLPKDMQPLVERLQDSADAFQKAAEPPLGKEEFFPHPEAQKAAESFKNTGDAAEDLATAFRKAQESVDEVAAQQKGNVEAAYYRWFAARGPEEERHASAEYFGAVAQQKAAVEAAQIRADEQMSEARDKAIASARAQQAAAQPTKTIGIPTGETQAQGMERLLRGGGAYGSGGLPAFQHGGIVRRPTVAMIGEAGPEAVVPLSSYYPGFPTSSSARTGAGLPEPTRAQLYGNVPILGRDPWGGLYNRETGKPIEEAYPQQKDVIPGVAGQTFTRLPYAGSANQQRIEDQLRAIGGDMLVELSKPGRHADYVTAVNQGLIPNVQAQAAMTLLRGGGRYGMTPGGMAPIYPGGFYGGVMPPGPSGAAPPSPTVAPSPAALAPTPAPTTSATPRSSAYAPTSAVDTALRSLRAGQYGPTAGSIAGGGGGGGGGFGTGGIVSTSDEGVTQRLEELLSIFRTS